MNWFFKFTHSKFVSISATLVTLWQRLLNLSKMWLNDHYLDIVLYSFMFSLTSFLNSFLNYLEATFIPSWSVWLPFFLLIGYNFLRWRSWLVYYFGLILLLITPFFYSLGMVTLASGTAKYAFITLVIGLFKFFLNK